jgi:hypothetical protein
MTKPQASPHTSKTSPARITGFGVVVLEDGSGGLVTLRDDMSFTLDKETVVSPVNAQDLLFPFSTLVSQLRWWVSNCGGDFSKLRPTLEKGTLGHFLKLGYFKESGEK